MYICIFSGILSDKTMDDKFDTSSDIKQHYPFYIQNY